jgi:hypothetical protein
MNKTVVQMLRFHVERNQTGWVRALPRIRFQIMNTTNKSTKFTPFQLCFGKTPRILPPLTAAYPSASKEATSAREVIECIQCDVADARDNLLLAKISQSYQANRHHTNAFPYKVGDWVWLDTTDKRRDFKDNNKGRTAKLMPRNDGPFQIITTIHPTTSTITVNWPTNSRIFPTFHISHAKPYRANDDGKYPGRRRDPLTPPPTLVVEEIDYIVDHKRRGRGISYLAHFKDQPAASRRWVPGKTVANIAALQDYWRNLRN